MRAFERHDTQQNSICRHLPPSVIPALSRNPADARLRGGESLFSPRTWAGWIPAQGRMTEGSDFHEADALDLADGEHGAHRIDILVGRQNLDHEILELGQVSRNAMQQEIAFA